MKKQTMKNDVIENQVTYVTKIYPFFCFPIHTGQILRFDRFAPALIPVDHDNAKARPSNA